MTADDSKLLRQLYAGALQRDPEERDDYLDAACAGRPELRARIAALIETHSADLAGATSNPLAAAPQQGGAEGRRIGDYVVRREIGRGGMGVVYLADDVRLQRRVALKALNPGVNATPVLRERLRNEARVAAGLSHPGIATVYALEEIDGELYMACEFIPGEPLRALVKSGPLPIEEVVDIGVQLTKALAEAHTYGIVHRDLKPENVIMTPSGVVKILDFGLALGEHITGQRLTQTGMIVGTPAYLSPEQALGQRADFRTDLFALGILLYELASGMNPFVAKSMTGTIAKIVEEDPAPLSDVMPGNLSALDRVIRICLHKDPAKRYATTHELLADLERVQADIKQVRSAPREIHLRATRTPVAAGWLVFHQIVVTVVYLAMVYPAWHARVWLAYPWSLLFLLGVLATTAAATTLRLHLWFTALHFPQQLAAQQARNYSRTRLSDVVSALIQIAAALAIGRDHPEFAMLFVSVSTALLVAAFVIEPATAAAVCPRQPAADARADV